MVTIDQYQLNEGQIYLLHDHGNEFYGKVKIMEVNFFYRYISCECVKTRERFHFSGHGLFYEI